MLKSELILPRLKKRGNEIEPLWLATDYNYLQIAAELIQIVKAHVGLSRGELEVALRQYEGDSLDYRIIRGLAQVLINRCIFSSDTQINPVTLRTSLFDKGPVSQKMDLLSINTREQAIAEVAAQFGITPAVVEQTLFADLIEERILLGSNEIWTPIDLIARYNLEIARGLLYWARELDLLIRDNYKELFKYIKLFKLMYTVYPLPQQGYNIVLHGPISPFVKSTIRYGLQFAKFLPALLLGQNWRLDAQVQPPDSTHPLHYTLNNTTSLRSHFKIPSLFDSQLEVDFATEFEAKYGGNNRQWLLAREDEIIMVGDTVMIPDFSLTHRQDGRRALIEIIGFWHPQYLQRKLQKIQQAARRDLILLVYESANVAQGVFEKVAAGEVLTFVNKPILKEVLAAVERCAIIPTSAIAANHNADN
jgi:predicted nuclease of restriction endonuclease-like RecB superfamily